MRGLGREYAYNITTLDKRLQRNAVNERMGATLASPAAMLTALLAFVGVYSLFAYALARRTREIGVRLAVGATPGGVLRMRRREGVTLTAIGVALGIPTGIMASRGLRALLFGVSESDPGCRIGRGVLPGAHDRGGAHSRAPRRTSGSRRRSPR